MNLCNYMNILIVYTVYISNNVIVKPWKQSCRKYNFVFEYKILNQIIYNMITLFIVGSVKIVELYSLDNII